MGELARQISMVALLWLATSCSSPPSSPPRAPVETAGRAVRLPAGNLEAYALEDGRLEVANDGRLLGAGRSPSEIADVLAAAGLPRDTIHLDIQCLLVKSGDRVILFDAGAGALLPGAGRLAQSLAHANVQSNAVTDVFVSHAHGDHVGGLLVKTGALAFPAATIHMSAPEWAAFQAETDEVSKRYVAAIAPKVVPFEPGAQVLPVVKAVDTRGHSAGHSSFEIGDELFFLGDVAHHSVISVQRPAWSIKVDHDPAAAQAMREQTLPKLAAGHTRVFAPHFPFPGVGRVVVDREGLAWRPDGP